MKPVAPALRTRRTKRYWSEKLKTTSTGGVVADEASDALFDVFSFAVGVEQGDVDAPAGRVSNI